MEKKTSKKPQPNNPKRQDNKEVSVFPLNAEKSHSCQSQLASHSVIGICHRSGFLKGNAVTVSVCKMERRQVCVCVREALSPLVSFSLFSSGPGRDTQREKLPQAHLH